MFAEYVTAYGEPVPRDRRPGGRGLRSAGSAPSPTRRPAATPSRARSSSGWPRPRPDAPADTFAADAWSGAKAFVDALEALPGPITREAILAQLRSMNDYDAGGLLGTIQLGNKLSNGCFVAMIVEGGAWRRLAPAQGFLC